MSILNTTRKLTRINAVDFIEPSKVQDVKSFRWDCDGYFIFTTSEREWPSYCLSWNEKLDDLYFGTRVYVIGGNQVNSRDISVIASLLYI